MSGLGLGALTQQIDLLLRIGDNIGGDPLEPASATPVPARPQTQTPAPVIAQPGDTPSSSATSLIGLRPPTEASPATLAPHVDGLLAAQTNDLADAGKEDVAFAAIVTRIFADRSRTAAMATAPSRTAATADELGQPDGLGRPAAAENAAGPETITAKDAAAAFAATGSSDPGSNAATSVDDRAEPPATAAMTSPVGAADLSRRDPIGAGDAGGMPEDAGTSLASPGPAAAADLHGAVRIPSPTLAINHPLTDPFGDGAFLSTAGLDGGTETARLSKSLLAARQAVGGQDQERQIADGLTRSETASGLGLSKTVQVAELTDPADRLELSLDRLDGTKTEFVFTAVDLPPGDRDMLDRVLAQVTFAQADEPAQMQLDRAGVIASFILNAAMIPGWPPPRPIEGVPLAAFNALFGGIKPSKSELELLLYLAKLGFSRQHLQKLTRRLVDRRHRSMLMKAVAILVTNIAAVLKTVQEEIERMGDEEADEARLRHPGARARIPLR